MGSAIEGDLNATIVAAVNARVEAEMMKALSGDEAIGRFVTASLQQSVEVKDGYRTKHVPFLTHVLEGAIRSSVKLACERLIAEELPTIEAEVRKALRRDVARIAKTLTNSLAEAAANTYGVKVNFDLLMPGRD